MLRTTCGPDRSIALVTVDEQAGPISDHQHNYHYLQLKYTRMLLGNHTVAWTPFIFPIINQSLHLDFCTSAQSPELLPCSSCVDTLCLGPL